MAQMNQTPDNGEMTQQEYSELVAIRRQKLADLQQAGKDPFHITKWPQADFAAEVKESFQDLPEDAAPEDHRQVCMAGRMMSKRVMGKASFADLRDTTGDIQMYVKRDDVGADVYQEFKKFDIGDIVGVRGYVFRTKMGEISVHVTEVVLLSKSLLPLPEKFHGLKDRRPATASGMWTSSSTPKCAAPLRCAAASSAICAAIWTSGTTWKWRPPC